MSEQSHSLLVAPGASEKPRERGFYDAYAGFARTLRTWLIAYGVGAPILFFRSPEAWKALGSQGGVRPFVYCFLLGIAVQVACALLFKVAMWYLYMEELGEIEKSTWKYVASEWISTAFWLELLLDVVTVALFGYATMRAIQVVVT